MKAAGLCAWSVACALVFALDGAHSQSQPPLALAGVHVVSTIDGSIERDATVLIVDRRIQRVSKADANEPLPAGTQIVRVDGRYVVPGLWDMHVHAFLDEHDPDWMFPLLVAHGVTGIRDMGSLVSLAKMRRVRAEVEQGTRIGPREVLSGPLADAAGADWISPAGVPGTDEAVQAVRRAKEQGADFIKIYPLITQDTYRAIATEARKLGLSVAGQVPESMTVAQVAQAGQRSIEHLEKLALGCSGAEAEVVAERRALLASARSNNELLDALTASTYTVIDRLALIDEGRCKAMIATLAQHRTAVVPTLVGTRIYVHAWRERNDPRLAMLPAIVRDTWLSMDTALRASSPQQTGAAVSLTRHAERLIGRLAGAGVLLLAGTQTAPITPFVFPGAAVHDELIALQRAGLSSLQALQAATIGPARFMEREAELGSVATGRWADLLVVEGNPAADITQIRRVHAVVVNGRLLDHAAIEALKRTAGSPRTEGGNWGGTAGGRGGGTGTKEREHG